MSRSSQILVTGATGFVGRALCRQLIDRGSDVIASIRPGGRPPTLTHPRLRVVEAELPALGEIAALENVGCVYHLAAVVDPAQAMDGERCRRVNHDGTVAIGNWATDHGAHLVFVSSIAAMGFYDAPGGATEDSPCRPSSGYGRTKLSAERALSDIPGASFCVLRPPTLYGPDDRYNFLALSRAVARRVFVLIAGGRNRFSIMHVDNLVAALTLAGDERLTGLYLADDGAATTMRDVTSTIARALGRSGWLPKIPYVAARPLATALDLATRPLGITPPLSRARLRTLTVDFGFDISRLHAAGFRPAIEWHRAVTETVQSFRRAGLL